jgi:hypothetical protein
MSRSETALIAAVLAAAIVLRPAWAVDTAPVPISNKPFMLFVTPLRPPEGAERAEAFSAAMFKELRQFFDTTSFQPILVETVGMVERMSNQKKDIILTTDTTDCYLRGTEHDTLVIWIRYKVGLLLSRVDVAYPKGRQVELPPLLAREAYWAIRDEFTGVVELEGGPPGMMITLVEGATVKPPRTMLFPPGDHYITSRFPGFKTRVDTLVVFQGRTTRKRILMLPD